MYSLHTVDDLKAISLAFYIRRRPLARRHNIEINDDNNIIVSAGPVFYFEEISHGLSSSQYGNKEYAMAPWTLRRNTALLRATLSCSLLLRATRVVPLGVRLHTVQHGPVISKLHIRQSPTGILAVVCASLLPLSSNTSDSRTRCPVVAFASSNHLDGTSVAKSRILQQMQEHASSQAIHSITNSTQQFDAFRDGGSVFDQIPTSCSIQSQNGVHISRPIR
jgi:hypothetical protein